MKKTISMAALAVSSSASFAIIMPPHMEFVTQTYCLNVHQDISGNMIAGTCDETRNNGQRHLQISENGCAAGQISLTTKKERSAEDFPIKVYPCLSPNITQL